MDNNETTSLSGNGATDNWLGVSKDYKAADDTWLDAIDNNTAPDDSWLEAAKLQCTYW